MSCLNESNRKSTFGFVCWLGLSSLSNHAAATPDYPTAAQPKSELDRAEDAADKTPCTDQPSIEVEASIVERLTVEAKVSARFQISSRNFRSVFHHAPTGRSLNLARGACPLVTRRTPAECFVAMLAGNVFTTPTPPRSRGAIL